MLTTIIAPGTGKTHTILPERWGLEKAVAWLKQGKCLLTSGLVYPRLDLSFAKEPTVSIFVGEHDLQRLMAKQEVKQEAASRSDSKKSRGEVSEVRSNPGCGGRCSITSMPWSSLARLPIPPTTHSPKPGSGWRKTIAR